MPLGNQWRGNRTASSHSTEGCPGNHKSSILLSRPMGTSEEANIRHEVVRPLKLFKLQRTADFPAGEGQAKSAFVLAHSAVDARRMLQDCSYGDEVGVTFGKCYPFPSLLNGTTGQIVSFWTKDMCASCEEICEVTYYLLPGRVLADLHSSLYFNTRQVLRVDYLSRRWS